ncbi:hypothetical protein WCLP8_900009 [uncultured Gammaproteobacteria bacterium]
MARTKLFGASPWFMPFSGDVWQKIFTTWFSPSFTVNYQGDPVIEQRVVTEVASYGRQLGWLSEIVLALAKNNKVPQDAFDKLTAAVDLIEDIKNRSSLVDEAEDALNRLTDSEAESLIKRRAERLKSRNLNSPAASPAQVPESAAAAPPTRPGSP